MMGETVSSTSRHHGVFPLAADVFAYCDPTSINKSLCLLVVWDSLMYPSLSCHVMEDGCELRALLPLSPECWE